MTSDKQSAGTNHNAWIVLIDDKGNQSKEILIENKTKNKLFSRGETNTMKIVSKHLGSLKAIVIGHRFRKGATLKKSSEEERWHLHEVAVKNLDTEDR